MTDDGAPRSSPGRPRPRAALTASATQPVIPATEESPSPAPVSTFTDANPTAPVSDFTATIDWGDGSLDHRSANRFSPAESAPPFTVDGVHTYKDNTAPTRIPRLSLTTDVGGQKVTTTDTVTVGDPGLTGATAVPVTAVEGASTGPVTLGRFVDPDPNSTPHDWSVAINWGDGTPVGTGTIALVSGDPASGGNVFAVVGSHTYADSPLTTSPRPPRSPTWIMRRPHRRSCS